MTDVFEPTGDKLNEATRAEAPPKGPADNLVHLSAPDQRILAQALLNPPAPSERLMAAARWHGAQLDQ